MADLYKTVNIEEGKPLVDFAIKRSTFEIKRAKNCGYIAIKIIHGYGSSGTGGRIKAELHKYLHRLEKRKEIKYFIPGESFDIFDKKTQSLFNVLFEASKDRDLGRHNSGVTIVVL